VLVLGSSLVAECRLYQATHSAVASSTSSIQRQGLARTFDRSTSKRPPPRHQFNASLKLLVLERPVPARYRNAKPNPSLLVMAREVAIAITRSANGLPSSGSLTGHIRTLPKPRIGPVRLQYR
jgi:hypothetical protein